MQTRMNKLPILMLLAMATMRMLMTILLTAMMMCGTRVAFTGAARIRGVVILFLTKKNAVVDQRAEIKTL